MTASTRFNPKMHINRLWLLFWCLVGVLMIFANGWLAFTQQERLFASVSFGISLPVLGIAVYQVFKREQHARDALAWNATLCMLGIIGAILTLIDITIYLTRSVIAAVPLPY